MLLFQLRKSSVVKEAVICFCAKCGLVEAGQCVGLFWSWAQTLVPEEVTCASAYQVHFGQYCAFYFIHIQEQIPSSLSTARQLSSRHHNFCFSSSSFVADSDLCVTGYSKFFSGSVKDHLYCEALSVVKNKRALLIQCVFIKPKIPQSPAHARKAKVIRR